MDKFRAEESSPITVPSTPDAVVLIATQSFTGEALVQDILAEKFCDAGLSVETRLVDEVFATEDDNPQDEVDVDGESEGATTKGGHHFWPKALREVMTMGPSSSSNPSPPVLFVASTFGDGDPPNHAVEFASWLSEGTYTRRRRTAAAASPQPTAVTAPLAPRYAVFGLGDSTYAKFAAFGKFVDRRLSEMGCRHILPLATGDANGDQAGEFERWCARLVDVIQQEGEGGVAAPAHGTEARTRRRPPKRMSPFPMGTGAEWRRSAIQRGGGGGGGGGTVVAKLGEARELLLSRGPDGKSKEKDRSVVHVTLALPSAEIPPDLQPGDHVGVHPANRASVVRRALEWLGIGPDATTKILERTDEGGGGGWKPREISSHEFLSEHVDLAGRASPTVLRSLLPFVGTLELRALARELTHVESSSGPSHKQDGADVVMEESSRHGGDDSSSAFDAWVAGRRLSALDLAILFDCRPSLQALARACGTLQPRLYSIVSVSSDVDDDDAVTSKIGLCVSVAKDGLCSNFLARLGEVTAREDDGEPSAHEFFRRSRFRFVPEDDDKPALLVAAGSGVGTCIGFIESELQRIVSDRMESSENAGRGQLLSHLSLFFGCRTKSDILYRERLSQFTEPALGLNLRLALSREPMQPKTYVQDLIRQHSKKLWQDLYHRGGSMYICGRLELLEGVKDALADVAEITGGLDHDAAQNFVVAMEDSGRIKTDCWSVDTGGAIDGEESSLHHHRPHVIPRLERHHARERQPPTAALVGLSMTPEWPSYLRLLASGELEHRVERAMDMWSACVACGRNCETNRLSPDPKDWGECRVGNQAIVASAFPHFGEEDCLVGRNGSGTIFFGACNLQCMYCQNWDISAKDQGQLVTDKELAQIMLSLQKRGCHNINFVSPTHNVAPILRAVLSAAKKGLRLPLVWNTGGYDSVASLRLLDGVIDIYMPDAKYASRAVARRLSKIDNYPEINQAAIKEMHRQVGDLEIDPQSGLARRGVLVRHLILPKHLSGCGDVMSFLSKEVSKDTFANVMDQYRPEHHAVRDKKYGLCNRPTRKELRDGHKEARSSGLRRLDGEAPHSLEW